MLIVFGPAMIELHFTTHALPENGKISDATAYTKEPAGRGANQALAACRSGAKVAFVSKVGDDDFGTYILGKLRREGIITSGIGKSNTPTGCAILTKTETGEHHHTIALSANHEIESDQVPEDILNEQSVLLLQTAIQSETNITTLEKAKKAGATTIMNLSPSIDLSQNTLRHLDHLIVNHEEATRLAIKLGLKAEQDTTKIAQALAKEGELNCIITRNNNGSVAVSKDGKAYKVGTLDVEFIDKTGAEDVYCGTFAAAIYMGFPLERAIKRASIAAALTCTKQGGQSTFPYLDDIESKLQELPDAEEITL